MWCYACRWDVRGDLTLNSMAQIHTLSLCLRHVISRGSRASTSLTFLFSHTFRETWPRLRVECSSDVVISCLQKNTLFMSAATLNPIRLQCYLHRLPDAKNSHEITWRDDMRVCHLTWREFVWREDSVSPAVAWKWGIGVQSKKRSMILMCNLAGLLTLNGVTLANWFCWWEAGGIGLELYQVASCVVIPVL